MRLPMAAEVSLPIEADAKDESRMLLIVWSPQPSMSAKRPSVARTATRQPTRVLITAA